jgi:pimeloyl-ACP methyl ester carboxylesterase
MGSAIALTLALDQPEHVLGLGLLGGGARLRVAPLLLESATSPTTFHNAVAQIVSWSFSPHAPEGLTRLAAERMADTRPSVLHGDFLACDGFDVISRLQEVRCPTLVLCGADDRMTKPRYSQFLAENIPAARLEIIPEAGHMVMLEQPQAVASALLDFLDGIVY